MRLLKEELVAYASAATMEAMAARVRATTLNCILRVGKLIGLVRIVRRLIEEVVELKRI
jgi:hypothetical protein